MLSLSITVNVAVESSIGKQFHQETNLRRIMKIKTAASFFLLFCSGKFHVIQRRLFRSVFIVSVQQRNLDIYLMNVHNYNEGRCV